MNEIAGNVCVKCSVWTCFQFFLSIYLGVQLLGLRVTVELFEQLPDCFPKWPHHYTYSHQLCVRVSISPHPHQHLLLSNFLIPAILVGMKWYLIVVLIFICLMVNDVDHLFMCLLDICISFISEKYKTIYHLYIFYIICISYISEMCIQTFCPFKKIGLSFYYWVVRILY